MKTAFIFPGQGAHVNKVSVLQGYDRQLYADEIEIISEAYGMDILDFALHADAATLSQVQYTQLIVFATSICFLAIAKKNGVRPDLVAGHSIGQFAAMYAAGCFDLAAEAGLVRQRATLMGEITTEGKLCAIKAPFPMDMAYITGLCDEISKQTGKILGPALINSDKQIVVGGEPEALKEISEQLRRGGRGYSSVILPVGQAFHTELMRPMLKPFEACLNRISVKEPSIPLVLNTTGAFYHGEDLRNELLAHCVRPVQWLNTMQTISEEKPIIYEVGLGHTLSGFFRNYAKTHVVPMEDPKLFFKAIRP